MIKIGIFGATGYTGLELLKLLGRHPAARIAWLTSESSAGQRFDAVFPVPPALGGHTLIPSAEADCAGVDVVFCCLPHVAAQTHVAAARKAGARTIDLSADFRLRDAATYEKWYGHPHQHAELLSEAVYGLPELHRAAIAGAGLIANPGCYPTSIILGLAPLARAGWLAGTIIADSKSGVFRRGADTVAQDAFRRGQREPEPSIGRAHRHIPEMEQELRPDDGRRTMDDGPAGWQLIFSPHLVPINRGMLSTIYVTLPAGVTEVQVREAYATLYAAEPFVYLLPKGQVADLRAHGQHELLRYRADFGVGHVNADRHLEHR